MTIIDETFIKTLRDSLESAQGDGQSFNQEPQGDDTKVFSRIVKLSSYRDRSAKELRDRLLDEQFDADSVSSALARACECGIVDDMRFADMLIRSRVSSGKGAYGIEHELEKHEIMASSIEGWPYEYGCSDEDQLDAAVQLLTSHPPQAKDAWGAAYRRLVGKGYSPSICTRAARIWAEANIQHEV